ncbi:hypothetical protein CRG98_004842 [Punica granatum]|uniref:Uncharacterized protein n=1 Tax=Punica granatum TaxID=22663 RepID=A0A2I0L3Q8_PUNGR|nr:hypothetical protein CRG98_004842 [Punica granatum]
MTGETALDPGGVKEYSPWVLLDQPNPPRSLSLGFQVFLVMLVRYTRFGIVKTWGTMKFGAKEHPVRPWGARELSAISSGDMAASSMTPMDFGGLSSHKASHAPPWHPRQSVEKWVGTRAPGTARCKVGLVGLLRGRSRRSWKVPNVPKPRQTQNSEIKLGKSQADPVGSGGYRNTGWFSGGFGRFRPWQEVARAVGVGWS